MASPSLIDAVQRQMQELGVTQIELAMACRLSQPHLSKVLTKKVKLATKTEQRLARWLEASGDVSEGSSHDFVHSLAARMEHLRPARRMQFMELLKAIERVIEI